MRLGVREVRDAVVREGRELRLLQTFELQADRTEVPIAGQRTSARESLDLAQVTAWVVRSLRLVGAA